MLGRPMDDNPYLMVGEDFDEDGEAPTTELGVIVEENQPGHPTTANARAVDEEQVHIKLLSCPTSISRCWDENRDGSKFITGG